MASGTPKEENVVAEIHLLLTEKGEKNILKVVQQGNVEDLSELTEALINSEEFATRTLIATMSTIVECYCKNKGIKLFIKT